MGEVTSAVDVAEVKDRFGARRGRGSQRLDGFQELAHAGILCVPCVNSVSDQNESLEGEG